MAKDPAFLFYSGDFLVGTYHLNDEQVGVYIRLLAMQHQKGGYLSEDDMTTFCRGYDKRVYDKFKVNEEGMYYNERLLEEMNKRKTYSDSRRNNRAKRETKKKDDSTYVEHMKTYVVHMENENVNINNDLSLSSSLKNNNKDFIEVVEYLNQKANKKFRLTTNTKQLIKTRLNEGFLIDDFYRVIDNQCTKWLTDPKMIDYLRPQTLFGTKFESYLNTVVVKKFNIMDL